MTEVEFQASVTRAIRQLIADPPMGGADEEPIDEVEERVEKLVDLTYEAMCGRGDFWPVGPAARSEYDCEQELVIVRAVRDAMAFPCATPAARWGYVERCVRERVEQYAEDIVERAE